MDFLGETIAESYRTGKNKKPNLKNPVSKARSKFRMKLEKDAKAQGRDLSDVALDHVIENSGQISKYILSKGEVPNDSNPVALAVQAYQLRGNEVNSIADAMGVDFDTASHHLDEAENRAMEIQSPEADSFIGELFDAIAHAAAPGLQKAADKHKTKTGKSGVAGFFSNLLQANDAQSGNSQSAADVAAKAGANVGNAAVDAAKDGSLGGILKTISNKIIDSQKKSEIKKMLPEIIIGIIVLIIIVVLLTKATSKK